MLQIQSPSQQPSSPHPILNLGFRIFFSAGAIFAIFTILLWIFIYMGKTDIDATLINPFYWHGHEMLYGYAMAIIAGFLLTAVKNWTGIMMPYGYRLLAIFSCWLVARLSWAFIGIGINHTQLFFYLAMLADLLFMGFTAWVIIKAVMAVKQYKQMGIISKLVLLTIGNGLCYWGVFSGDMDYVRIGIYLGLYLTIGIVLTIGRRVVPFFIERGLSHGTDKEVKVKNSIYLDALSLISFLILMLADIFFPNPYLITASALIVTIVNSVRLFGWYKKEIWQKPLLWSLFLAFIGMCIGFLIFALQPWFGFDHSLAVHGLSLSAIGMMTIAMMSRVSLGHTGRSIHAPPKTVSAMFALMVVTFIFRVIMPILANDQYIIWIMIAQTTWMIAFALFCFSYLPMLSKPRTDKLFG